MPSKIIKRKWKQKKQMGRRSAAIGTVLAWIFLIPVVICLFINRLQGGGMGWFIGSNCQSGDRRGIR